MGSLKAILGQTAYFMINKKLLLAIGLDATLFLQHLIDLDENYFEGEFWQRQNDIEKSTGLSSYQQRKATEKLVKFGFIEVTKKGLPAKNHFKIDNIKIVDFLLSTNSHYTGKKSKPLKNQKVNDIDKEKSNKEKNKEKELRKREIEEHLLLNLVDEIKQFTHGN